jgi:hypothetical protein
MIYTQCYEIGQFRNEIAGRSSAKAGNDRDKLLMLLKLGNDNIRIMPARSLASRLIWLERFFSTALPEILFNTGYLLSLSI